DDVKNSLASRTSQSRRGARFARSEDSAYRQWLSVARLRRHGPPGCAVDCGRRFAGEFVRYTAHDAFRDGMRGGQYREVHLQHRMENIVALAQGCKNGGGRAREIGLVRLQALGVSDVELRQLML